MRKKSQRKKLGVLGTLERRKTLEVARRELESPVTNSILVDLVVADGQADLGEPQITIEIEPVISVVSPVDPLLSETNSTKESQEAGESKDFISESNEPNSASNLRRQNKSTSHTPWQITKWQSEITRTYSGRENIRAEGRKENRWMWPGLFIEADRESLGYDEREVGSTIMFGASSEAANDFLSERSSFAGSLDFPSKESMESSTEDSIEGNTEDSSEGSSEVFAEDSSEVFAEDSSEVWAEDSLESDSEVSIEDRSEGSLEISTEESSEGSTEDSAEVSEFSARVKACFAYTSQLRCAGRELTRLDFSSASNESKEHTGVAQTNLRTFCWLRSDDFLSESKNFLSKSKNQSGYSFAGFTTRTAGELLRWGARVSEGISLDFYFLKESGYRSSEAVSRFSLRANPALLDPYGGDMEQMSGEDRVGRTRDETIRYSRGSFVSTNGESVRDSRRRWAERGEREVDRTVYSGAFVRETREAIKRNEKILSVKELGLGSGISDPHFLKESTGSTGASDFATKVVESRKNSTTPDFLSASKDFLSQNKEPEFYMRSMGLVGVLERRRGRQRTEERERREVEDWYRAGVSFSAFDVEEVGLDSLLSERKSTVASRSIDQKRVYRELYIDGIVEGEKPGTSWIETSGGSTAKESESSVGVRGSTQLELTAGQAELGESDAMVWQESRYGGGGSFVRDCVSESKEASEARDFLSESKDFLSDSKDFLSESKDFLSDSKDFLSDSKDFLSESKEASEESETSPCIMANPSERGEFQADRWLSKPMREVLEMVEDDGEDDEAGRCARFFDREWKGRSRTAGVSLPTTLEKDTVAIPYVLKESLTKSKNLSPYFLKESQSYERLETERGERASNFYFFYDDLELDS